MAAIPDATNPAFALLLLYATRSRMLAMIDQDYLQKIIRAYVACSVMMRSDTLSPKTKELVRDLTNNLEEELTKVRQTTISHYLNAA